MPLLVERIENGTVIDRIDPFFGIRVLEILQLAPKDPRAADASALPRLALVINVPSRHMGRKDILKIENRVIKPSEADKIALIAPRARLNTVKGGQVVSKVDLKLPARISSIARCPNPRCASALGGLGEFLNEDGRLRCHFCERLFKSGELIVE